MAKSAIKWFQWETRSNGVKAFAVDTEAEQKNGILRAVNGAVVPEGAEPAKPSTPKDEFCASIIAKREANGGKTAKQIRAEKFEAAKAERLAKKANEAPQAKVRVFKKVVKVMLGNKVLGEFEAEKFDATEGVETVVKVTDKTWGVYQNKQRIASGKLAAEEEAAAAE